MATWVGIVVTGLLTVAGLYYGNNLRRRTHAEIDARVAEKRLPAYQALWAATKVASPMRGRPLTPEEREQLFDDLTDWYYDGGNGMLLTETTRNIYLRAKANLTCPDEELVPWSLRQRVAAEGETARGQAAIDQFSLLRTAMRADVQIFTHPYDAALGPEDVAFLEECDVDLRRLPWRNALPAKPVRRGG